MISNKLKNIIDDYLLPRVREIVREEQQEPDYYTSKDMNEKFGLTSALLYKYRKKGLIEYTQIGQKVIYPRAGVRTFLKNHTKHKNK